MKFRVGSTAVFIGYEVAAAITAVLILDRENRVICCILAAALHELGHLLMLRLFRIPVRAVSLRLFDVRIDAEQAPGLCAGIGVTLGGVGMNFLCALLSIPFSRTLCCAHLALGVFNLLPAMTLDGGRLLYLLLARRFMPKTCIMILKTVTFFISVPLMTAGILILFRSGYNYSLLAVSLYLLAVLLFK